MIKNFDLQKNIDKRKNGEIRGYEIYNKPSYIQIKYFQNIVKHIKSL